MKNVAYKTIKNNPNIPDGFIVDHFETDEDKVEGYTVVDKNNFTALLANNVMLMRTHEVNKGIIAADPTQPPHPIRPNEHAEVAEINIRTGRQKAVEQQMEKNRADMELFKQFMAWKASQGSGS